MSTPAANFDALLDTLASKFELYKNNFTTQLNETFTRLTPQQMIRLVVIIGAYCLLRPYLIKLGGRFQAADHERELDHEEMEKMRRSEGYNRGSLKDKVEIPEDTDSESSDDGHGGGGGNSGAAASGTSWGKKARRRQRRVMRQLIDAEEKRRLEEEEAESDKELEQWMEK